LFIPPPRLRGKQPIGLGIPAPSFFLWTTAVSHEHPAHG